MTLTANNQSKQAITFENAAGLAGQNITLSCLVQAAAIPSSSQFPTRSLSSTSLPANGNVTVTLSTAAATTAGLTRTRATFTSAQARGAHPSPFSAFRFSAIGFLGLVLLTGKRKQRPRRSVRALLILMLMLAILLLLVSCGGGAAEQPQQPHTVGGTPAGTYLVSLVGSDASHNPVVVATIPLNVQ